MALEAGSRLKGGEGRLEADLIEHETVIVHRVGPPCGQPGSLEALDLSDQTVARSVGEQRKGVDVPRLLCDEGSDERGRIAAVHHLRVAHCGHRPGEFRIEPLTDRIALEERIIAAEWHVFGGNVSKEAEAAEGATAPRRQKSQRERGAAPRRSPHRVQR